VCRVLGCGHLRKGLRVGGGGRGFCAHTGDTASTHMIYLVRTHGSHCVSNKRQCVHTQETPVCAHTGDTTSTHMIYG
jgi:hypothetical protein